MSVNQQQRKKKSDGGQNIKVYIRVRPMNATEKSTKNFCCVECQNNKEVVVKERQLDKFSKKFSFDKVFPENSKQEDIYKVVAKPLVEEVLNGFNCTIFAYGQTGTGKTFTMEGENLNVEMNFEENKLAGIVPRCVGYLFDELRIQQMEFTMRVSFLELYNEELFDLLSANDDLTKLRLYEDATRKGSCIIQGLEEVVVKSKMDVYNIVKKGSAKRQTAATLMNAHSSRSHTVFTVTVHIKETTSDGNEMLKTGKLHLVDLAGSENIGRSGAVDKRAREAGNINQSLLTVGRVITSLVEKAPHIPYRESKLTRLLQDALGGRTKTSIIATVSPASINLEETLSTLDYAHRAKNIQNRPEANQKLNKKELITEYSAEIDRLQRDLLATREKNGVYLANENYVNMVATIEEQSKELLDKISYLRLVEEEHEKLKGTFQEVSSKLEETTDQLVQSEAMLSETKETLGCTQKLLTITATERDEQSYLKSAHKTTETKLLTCGKRLISVADTTTADIFKLHGKIDRGRIVESDNEHAGDDISSNLKDETDRIRANLQEALHMQRTSLNRNISQLGSIVKESEGKLEEMLGGFKDLSTFASNSLSGLTDALRGIEENTKKDIKKFVAKTTANVSTIEKDCDHAFVSKVAPFLTTLNLCLVSIDSLVLNLKEETAKKLEEIEKCCERSSKEHMSNLKLLEEQHYSMLQTFRQNSDFQEQQVKLLQQEEDEHIKALDDIVEAAVAAKKKRQATCKCYIDMATMQGKTNEETAEKSDKICETSGIMGCAIPRDQSQIKSLVEEVHHIKDLICSEYGEKSVTLKSAQTEVAADLETHHSNRAAAFTKFYTDATDFQGTLCQSMASSIIQPEKLAETMVSELVCTLNKKGLMLEAQQHSAADETNSVRDSIYNTLQSVTDVHLKQDDLLSDCSLHVTDSLQKHMKTNVPTGETPVRKTYQYSRNLPETSPHQRLLSRFRGKNCTTTTPVPNTELEDISSNSASSSSSNSDSDLNNEAFLGPQKPQLRRSGSFKEPPTFGLGRTTSNITKEIKPCPLSKSSSVPCIGDLKENHYDQKKRELRAPSTVTSYNVEKLRPRKILGPLN